jgi:hypothetical protein
MFSVMVPGQHDPAETGDKYLDGMRKIFQWLGMMTRTRRYGATMKITKNTKATDALKMSGNILEVFRKHDLYCPGCKGIGEDTIEKIATCNGMDVEKFLSELNGALE